jgi:phosphatidylglycerophosphate synthase
MRRFGRTLVAIAALRTSMGVLVMIAFDPKSFVATAICLAAFIAGLLSDQVDGWIARKYSCPSVAGYLQDSVSDKLFHIGCLLGLIPFFGGVALVLWVTCSREIGILAIRVVTNDVGSSLVRFKKQSIAYAAALRLGIGSALVFSLTAKGNPSKIELIWLYGILCLAGGLGLLNLLALLRFSRTNESPRVRPE